MKEETETERNFRCYSRWVVAILSQNILISFWTIHAGVLAYHLNNTDGALQCERILKTDGVRDRPSRGRPTLSSFRSKIVGFCYIDRGRPTLVRESSQWGRSSDAFLKWRSNDSMPWSSVWHGILAGSSFAINLPVRARAISRIQHVSRFVRG
jgi:hypothetical protein